jgi:hypothetical protein
MLKLIAPVFTYLIICLILTFGEQNERLNGLSPFWVGVAIILVLCSYYPNMKK